MIHFEFHFIRMLFDLHFVFVSELNENKKFQLHEFYFRLCFGSPDSVPAAKMTITTCKKDGNYPHVSQKSNKISKSTAVRATNEMASLAISSLTSQNGKP